MARLIDLKDDEHAEAEAEVGGHASGEEEESNPNIGPFSAALACYP
jgi:hypothetical protein